MREKTDGKERALPQILLLTHGHFGTELVKSAEMIVGDIEEILFVPLTLETSIEEYREAVRKTIANLRKGSIVLADLFGGTPCNTAAVFSREYTVHLIAGVNLTVLLESVQLRTQYSGQALCEKILENAQESIQYVTARM